MRCTRERGTGAARDAAREHATTPERLLVKSRDLFFFGAPLFSLSFSSRSIKKKKNQKKKNSARLPRVAVAWVRNYLAELALYFGIGGKKREERERE